MVPQVFLLLLGNSAALLVTDFNHLREYVIKLFDMLVRSLHILERIIEESVHDVGT